MNDTPSPLPILNPPVRRGLTGALWAVFFLCLLPFVVFSFFDFMSGDDYGLDLRFHQFGFWGVQNYIYTQWTGRFAASFLGAVFVRAGWLEKYYFLHSLLLFAGSWLSIFFLLSSINRYWLAGRFTRVRIALCASILLMIAIYVQPEPATGFYWFSSAITYQTSVILFLLLAGCLIGRFTVAGGRRPWFRDTIILLLILLIMGCNEVAAVFLCVFLTALVAVVAYHKRTMPRLLAVYTIIAFIAGAVLLFSSGILSVRHGLMNANTSFVMILPIILFRWAEVFYSILRIPLVWVAGYLLFVIGRNTAAQPFLSSSLILSALKKKRVIGLGLAVTPVLVFLTLTVVLIASKGSLPDRALNMLVGVSAFCLLAFCFWAGIIHSFRSGSFGSGAAVANPPAPAFLFIATLMLGMVANDAFAQAWKSVFSGFLYHSVQQDRRQLMEQASEHHQQTVVLAPYDEALQDKIHQVFPRGIFSTVNTMLKERPPLLFNENGLDQPDPGWLNFYRLDSVTIGPSSSALPRN
jgi:hypothetical protein